MFLLMFMYFFLILGINGDHIESSPIEEVKAQSPSIEGNEIGMKMEGNGFNCTFFDFEEPNKEKYPLDCPSPDELRNLNLSYGFLNQNTEKYNEMQKNTLEISTSLREIKSIHFFGYSYAGKSTVVQIIGTDNSHLYSIRKNPKSSDFIIIDKKTSKIGNQTTISHTLFPKYFIDKETNYFLWDNPDFSDEIYEVMPSISMRKALQDSNKIKIAIVVNHASLVYENYRADFQKTLINVCKMFHNIDKLKESFYLIATEVENKVMFNENNSMTFVPDETIINDVGLYLKKVKSHLEIMTNYGMHDDNAKFSIKIIDTLLETDSKNTLTRIGIVRRPKGEGPLINESVGSFIMKEREYLRKMLLNDEYMVPKDAFYTNAFGYFISLDVVNYLKKLFEVTNYYMTTLSVLVYNYIVKHYEQYIDSNYNLPKIIYEIKSIENNTKLLFTEMSNVKNPKQLIDSIDTFSKKTGINFNCFSMYTDIGNLLEYLSYLGNIFGNFKHYKYYNYRLWRLTDKFHHKLQHHESLLHIFEYLTDYNIQRNITEDKSSILNRPDKQISFSEEDIDNIFRKFELEKFCSSISSEDDVFFEKLYSVINVTLSHSMNITCERNTLFISDYIVLFSQINSNVFKACLNANEIIISAVHTVYIDANLTDNFFKGKILKLIAPVWEVIGSNKKVININGMDGGEKLKKASMGEIGEDGRTGNDAGIFIGVGMKFVNCKNLEITAVGGRGQDGQDGGNGVNGTKGTDGSVTYEQYQESHPTIWIIYNQYLNIFVSKGSTGTPGGDSGAGGKGGKGGEKGIITIHNFGNHPGINIKLADGERGLDGTDGVPGIGGQPGRTLVRNKYTDYFFIIPYHFGGGYNYENRVAPIVNGTVKKSYRKTITVGDKPRLVSEQPICVSLNIYQESFYKTYYNHVNDGITLRFINLIKLINSY